MARTALFSTLLLGYLFLYGGNAMADPERGRTLYENHCTQCHESTVHIRERRKANNFAVLQGFVERWANELALGWSREEIDQVLPCVFV